VNDRKTHAGRPQRLERSVARVVMWDSDGRPAVQGMIAAIMAKSANRRNSAKIGLHSPQLSDFAQGLLEVNCSSMSQSLRP